MTETYALWHALSQGRPVVDPRHVVHTTSGNQSFTTLKGETSGGASQPGQVSGVFDDGRTDIVHVNVVGERACVAEAGAAVLHVRTPPLLGRRMADEPLTAVAACRSAVIWADDEDLHRVA